MRYLMRIKNIPRKRLAGMIMEYTRLLTEYGAEEEFGIDFDLDTLPEMYELPEKGEKEQENKDEYCDCRPS